MAVVKALIEEMAERGIRLSARSDGGLHFEAPADVMTPAVFQQLWTHRQAILDLLAADLPDGRAMAEAVDAAMRRTGRS